MHTTEILFHSAQRLFSVDGQAWLQFVPKVLGWIEVRDPMLLSQTGNFSFMALLREKELCCSCSFATKLKALLSNHPFVGKLKNGVIQRSLSLDVWAIVLRKLVFGLWPHHEHDWTCLNQNFRAFFSQTSFHQLWITSLYLHSKKTAFENKKKIHRNFENFT